MAFKYFKGKLYKTFNNILEINYEEQKNSVFHTDIFLCEISEENVNKILDQKSLNHSINNFQKSIAKDYFLKNNNEIESEYVQGYVCINDLPYYAFGLKIDEGKYSLFCVEKDANYISLNITDNNAMISTITYSDEGAFYDLDCGIGKLKDENPKVFEKQFIENINKFRFKIPADFVLEYLQFFDDREISTGRFNYIEEKIKSGLYHKKLKKRMDPYVYIKEIDNKLRKARMSKFGVSSYCKMSMQQIEELGAKYQEFNQTLEGLLIEQAINKISEKYNYEEDVNDILRGAFDAILQDADYYTDSVKVSYIQSIYSAYGYAESNCYEMFKNICNKSPRKVFVDCLLEILDGNEDYAKDIIDLYSDGIKLLNINAKNSQYVKKDTFYDRYFYRQYESQKTKIIKEATDFVSYGIRKMGFDENQINQLVRLYGVYSIMTREFKDYEDENYQEKEPLEEGFEEGFEEGVEESAQTEAVDDEYLKIEEKSDNIDEYLKQELKKLNESEVPEEEDENFYEIDSFLKSSMKLHNKLIDEYGRRIIFSSKEERRKALNKNESFLDIIEYTKKGKIKKTPTQKNFREIDGGFHKS